MRTHRLFALFLAFVLVLAATPGWSVAVGQIDDFEDGTLHDWSVGPPHPAPPENVPGDGPAGTGDHYMLLTALGSAAGSAGSRFAVFNLSQWTGDYLVAGVAAIAADVNNFGATELKLRLYFGDLDPSGPLQFPGAADNVAISTDAVSVPAGSGWVRVLFPIALSDLTALRGTAAAALANVTRIEIYHSPDLIFAGPQVVASLGVDNLEAFGGLPDIRVSDSVAPAADLQLAMGSVEVGDVAEQTITVTNASSANLVLGNVGLPAAPFSVTADACSGQPLAPGAECVLTVAFSPTEVGAEADVITIPSDDPDEAVVTLDLSGTGADPDSSSGSSGGCFISAVRF